MAKVGKYDEVVRELLEENPDLTKGGMVKRLQAKAKITGGNAYQALSGALKRGVVIDTGEGLQVAPERSGGPEEASPEAGSNGRVSVSKPRKGKMKKVLDTVPVTFTVELPKGPVTLTTRLSMKKLVEIDRILKE